MKKIIVLILVTALCFATVGCAKTDRTDADKIRIASLKGPTSIGMLKLIDDESDTLEFTIAGIADEITAPFIQGKLDIVSVPCNLASVLYGKLSGDLQVLCVNTLGVLYLLDSTGEIGSISDLSGKTVYSTGKGTTPEYVFNYLLRENGLVPGTDTVINYLGEATQVASMLSEKKAQAAVLPQPYATSVTMQNGDLSATIDLSAEWKKLSGGKDLVTGVIVAKKSYIEKNKDKIDGLLDKYRKSVEFAVSDVDATASLCVKYGIIANESVAKAAIPRCNINYIDGDRMKEDISYYLGVLCDADPKSVGRSLPKDDFYYKK